MSSFLTIVQVVLSFLLILSIMLQHRASGLSATFGGSGAVVMQRRGAERVLYVLTIWMSIAFFLIPVIQWYL
ncbi:TPA: preprotein translocase subunit SecG [Candidatus Peribacteria bacterium]|nr:MAG: preprotein translocase subunit SecG [Candidatus Peribacteria bacterium RIFOXYC2_FULL_58_10]OGJ83780.1 MAG: preprotein translocase subunit SecG [Candidatus Peribacteria bacterium RIFOXYD2_FULL_58_15]HAI98519.1 preprotein translocase subunit SecG [Candidatus Peribacteria bacterium]HAS34231.1 preprotein translocase subunit SecG [Candidatus Peribacteria bacterium]